MKIDRKGTKKIPNMQIILEIFLSVPFPRGGFPRFNGENLVDLCAVNDANKEDNIEIEITT